jgi:fumarate reductase flavoprotein subunit
MAQRDYDVIVIGGGGAGVSAAHDASSHGAKVLLLEAAPQIGGSTAKSQGVFYAAGTRTQKERGFRDDVDAMYKYYCHVNQMRVEPALARKLCELAEPNLEWLMSLGVVYPPELLYQSCVDDTPRGHVPDGYGAGTVAAIQAVLKSRDNVTIRCNARVRELLIGADGSVSGVRIGDKEIHAGAVVISSGGFGHDPALMQQYYPSVAAAGDWLWCISGSACKGDGIHMGKQAGAAIQGYDKGLVGSSANFSHEFEFGRPPWLVYVNRHGRRFASEAMLGYFIHSAMLRQPGGSVFAIFDEEARLALATPDKAFYTEHHKLVNHWTPESILEKAQSGKILRRDTLEELGEAVGIYNPKALANTIAHYNQDAEAGKDSLFFKDPKLMRSMRKGPFYAVELRMAAVFMTFAGLRINPDAQVMSEDEEPIAGLYAAGEATGNVLGEQYIGGGISVANAISYGRVAGTSAVRFARG